MLLVIGTDDEQRVLGAELVAATRGPTGLAFKTVGHRSTERYTATGVSEAVISFAQEAGEPLVVVSAIPSKITDVVLDLFEKTEVLSIHCTATSSLLPMNDKYGLRTVPSDYSQWAIINQYYHSVLGAPPDVTIFHSTEPYGYGLVMSALQSFGSTNPNVAVVPLGLGKSKQEELETAATTIKNGNAAVYLLFLNDGADVKTLLETVDSIPPTSHIILSDTGGYAMHELKQDTKYENVTYVSLFSQKPGSVHKRLHELNPDVKDSDYTDSCAMAMHIALAAQSWNTGRFVRVQEQWERVQHSTFSWNGAFIAFDQYGNPSSWNYWIYKGRNFHSSWEVDSNGLNPRRRNVTSDGRHEPDLPGGQPVKFRDAAEAARGPEVVQPALGSEFNVVIQCLMCLLVVFLVATKIYKLWRTRKADRNRTSSTSIVPSDTTKMRDMCSSPLSTQGSSDGSAINYVQHSKEAKFVLVTPADTPEERYVEIVLKTPVHSLHIPQGLLRGPPPTAIGAQEDWRKNNSQGSHNTGAATTRYNLTAPEKDNVSDCEIHMQSLGPGGAEEKIARQLAQDTADPLPMHPGEWQGKQQSSQKENQVLYLPPVLAKKKVLQLQQATADPFPISAGQWQCDTLPDHELNAEPASQRVHSIPGTLTTSPPHSVLSNKASTLSVQNPLSAFTYDYPIQGRGDLAGPASGASNDCFDSSSLSGSALTEKTALQQVLRVVQHDSVERRAQIAAYYLENAKLSPQALALLRQHGWDGTSFYPQPQWPTLRQDLEDHIAKLDDHTSGDGRSASFSCSSGLPSQPSLAHHSALGGSASLGTL